MTRSMMRITLKQCFPILMTPYFADSPFMTSQSVTLHLYKRRINPFADKPTKKVPVKADKSNA